MGRNNFYFVALGNMRGEAMEVQINAPSYSEAQRIASAQYPGYSVRNVRQATTKEGGAAIEIGVLDLLKVLVWPLIFTLRIISPGQQRRRSLFGSFISGTVKLILFALIVAGVIAYLAKTSGNVTEAEQNSGTEAFAVSPAFVNGQAARREWENWVNSLSGDEKQGAIYWAAERSKRDPEGCDGTPDFASACFEAQRRLHEIDAYRRSDPDFRRT